MGGGGLLNSHHCIAMTIIKLFKNKKSSINYIPVEIIKKVSHIISPLLSQLFNESISAGIFPDKLKTSRVIPLFKQGDTTSIKNLDQ